MTLNCNTPKGLTTRCVAASRQAHLHITISLVLLERKEVVNMWKYLTDEQCYEFLLSLNLINDNITDKQKIKKLYSISNNVESNYRKFKIRKRNGKFRTIYEPNGILKHIQKQILNNILENKKVSKYAKAYYKGVTLKDNAGPHINKKMILKLDIKDFFENISFLDVYDSCFPIEYFPKSIGMLLTYLCTYNDYLPQGAPTSSYISNLVLKDFDEVLGAWCEEQNIAYTRYSDDMTFSGDFNPNIIIKKVRKMLYKLGLEINEQKIHVVHNSSKQIVTGIVVNKKISIDKNYKKKIRQEIYYINKFGLESHLDKLNINNREEYLSTLYGKILFVLQIENNNKEFKKYKLIIKNLTPHQ